jgi:simple sugar transport system permease protein
MSDGFLTCWTLNSLLIVGFGIPSIVATIGTQFFFRGIVNVLAAGNGISLISAKTAPDSWAYQLFVGRIGGAVPAQFVWFVALSLLLWCIFYRHKFGSHVSFVGDNLSSSIMMGINVKRIKLAVFVIMGIFASLSGILSNFEVTYFYPSQGDGVMMPALAAVFIGGTSVFGGKGTIVGSFIGTLIIGSLEAGIVAIGINGFWIKFIYGLIIIISVSIYSFILRKTK